MIIRLNVTSESVSEFNTRDLLKFAMETKSDLRFTKELVPQTKHEARIRFGYMVNETDRLLAIKQELGKRGIAISISY